MGFLSNTITTELDNGIRLCYFHKRGSSVELQFHILTGSVHEGEYLGHGLSHFLEHMLFQGCAGYPGLTVRNTVNDLGGDLNAYTSYDRTCYRMRLPREHWRQALEMLCAMIRFPECPESRFEAEKKVILREWDLGRDSVDRCIHEKFFRTMFAKHPLRYPIIGFKEMISQVTREMMMDYHYKRYTPGRCLVVVVGDLEAREFFDLCNARLGDWPQSFLSEPVLPDEAVPASFRQQELIFPDAQERLFMGMRGPGLGDTELPAVDLLFGLLGAGESSLLNRSLVLERELALGVRAFCFQTSDTTIAGISAVTETGKMPRFRSALLKELENVAAGNISPQAIKREKGQMYADRLRDLRDPVLIGENIASGMICGNSPDEWERYLDDLNKIDLPCLRKTAAKCLDLSHWGSVWQHNGKNRKEKVADSEKLSTSRIKSSTGIPVIVSSDHELPLCSFFMVFSGGALFEPAGSRGISQIVTAALTAGCGKYSENAFLQKMDEAGIELNISGGLNSITLSFSAPRRKMNMAVALIAEMLRSPKFEKEAVDREIFRALEVVKNVEYNPSRKAYSQALKNLYGDHPYAYGKLGKMEDISALTPEKIRKFYLDCLAGKIVMGFAGDCSITDAEKWSAVIENALPRSGTALPLPEFGGFCRKSKRESLSMEREQTVVMRMIPGAEFAGNDEFDLFELLQQSENGLASTLFNEVREKHALCYSVGMNFFAGFHPGAVCFYSMTEMGAEDKVMELLNKEITRLAEEGLSESEFDAAKTALLFDIARSGDSAEKLLNTMAMDIYYGKDENEFALRQERIRNLDLASFNAAIKPYFSAPAGVEVVIKPEKK